MKICLVSSQGGHLTELFQIISAFEGKDVFIITHDEKYTRELNSIYSIKTYLIKDLLVENSLRFRYLKILLNMLLILFKELYIFFRERPDIVVSTGAEIAIPIIYIAKIFGKKVIFIESLCRINELSNTGKLIYPVADLFLVQWEFLIDKYKKAIYKGKVL